MKIPDSPSSTSYDPGEYWETHLRRRPGLLGTGHRQFSLPYNEMMYQIATERLRAALEATGIDLNGQAILDVGAGFGYFIRRFEAWGAGSITGIELTKVGVRELCGAFPQHTFIQADISTPDLALPQRFDLVSAISMIFHIVDEARFRQALHNLCTHVKPGGCLLVVDAFRPTGLPTAAHARLRGLAAYTPILAQHSFDAPALFPMYHLMGRTFVPGLGPLLLNQPAILRWLATLDRKIGAASPSRLGWLNYLIARRPA